MASSGVSLPNALQNAFAAASPTYSLQTASVNTSTFYSTKYSINNFIPIYEIEYPDGTVDIIPDINSPNLNKLMQSLTSWSPYKFTGNEKLPGISYRAYKTTSLDWLIGMYNGVTHFYEIANGTTLRIPALTQIDQFLQTTTVINNVGKKVTI